eukprot:758402-Hanusia_phi.AAC.3
MLRGHREEASDPWKMLGKWRRSRGMRMRKARRRKETSAGGGGSEICPDPHDRMDITSRPFKKASTTRKPNVAKLSRNHTPSVDFWSYQTRSLKLPFFHEFSKAFVEERNRMLALKLKSTREPRASNHLRSLSSAVFSSASRASSEVTQKLELLEAEEDEYDIVDLPAAGADLLAASSLPSSHSPASS